MAWFHLPAYFLAGAFLANFVPHFVSGVLGRVLPTPFASPPFRGLSSPRVNVLWGLCNLAVAYALFSRVGDFEPRRALHAGTAGLGLTAMSLALARSLDSRPPPARDAHPVPPGGDGRIRGRRSLVQ